MFKEDSDAVNDHIDKINRLKVKKKKKKKKTPEQMEKAFQSKMFKELLKNKD